MDVGDVGGGGEADAGEEGGGGCHGEGSFDKIACRFHAPYIRLELSMQTVEINSIFKYL